MEKIVRIKNKIEKAQQDLNTLRHREGFIREKIANKESEIFRLEVDLNSEALAKKSLFYKNLENRFFKYIVPEDEIEESGYSMNVSAILEYDEFTRMCKELTIYKNIDHSFDFQVTNIHLGDNSEYYDTPELFKEIRKKEFDFYHNACLGSLNLVKQNTRNVLIEKRKK